MLDAGQDLPLGRSITFEFVRNDHARDVREPLEQLAEKLLGGFLVPSTLPQNIEHVAVLIPRPPEIMAFPMDMEAYFVKMPLVAGPGPSMPELIGVGLAKLAAPLPD